MLKLGIPHRLLQRSYRCVQRGGAGTLTQALLIVAASSFADPGAAGEADVIEVETSCTSTRVCRFSVTLTHGDEGWEHYADQWEILTPDGHVLGTRVLAHPHVREQPFTRSLGNVTVPPELTEVIVRARDSVHGYGGREKVVPLPH